MRYEEYDVEKLEKLHAMLQQARKDGDTAVVEALEWALDYLKELLPQMS